MAININSFYNFQVTKFGVFGGAFSSTDLRVFLGSTTSALKWSSNLKMCDSLWATYFVLMIHSMWSIGTVQQTHYILSIIPE
jgi:hypothetical protein